MAFREYRFRRLESRWVVGGWSYLWAGLFGFLYVAFWAASAIS